MKKLPFIFIAILLTYNLTACEKVKTTQYYRENPDDRAKVLQKCRDESDKGNKLEGKLAENCQNAHRADVQNIAGAIRNANR